MTPQANVLCAGSAPRSAKGGGALQRGLKAPKLPGSTASLDLERIPSGWSLLKGDLNFQRGQKYIAGAYNATTHVRMADVAFTKESKEKVTTGRILVQDYIEQRPGAVDVLLSAAEFSARAQRYC